MQSPNVLDGDDIFVPWRVEAYVGLGTGDGLLGMAMPVGRP